MRQAGILMHLTSLPSPWGIGTMGQAARDFADFLADAGQSVWQLLPVCPTSFGDSPYQSFSAFAGNPYLIDLDTLAQEGLLRPEEYRDLNWGRRPDTVDYGVLYEKRQAMLRKAVERLLSSPPDDYASFCLENAFWLEDYTCFMALKSAHGDRPWWEWEPPLRYRRSEVLDAFRAGHGGDLAFWSGVQYLFFRQWRALKHYVNQKGVSIIGDLPIYVAEDSADVWSHPEQFLLDDDLRPTLVAGCPDGFSPTGSYGATLCSTGRLWSETVLRGGRSGSATRKPSMTFCGSTISEVWMPFTPSRSATPPHAAATGGPDPAGNCSPHWPRGRGWIM